MKVRKGFVTNSSSSSFIVAIKDDGSSFFRTFIDGFVHATGGDTSIGKVYSDVGDLTDEYKKEYCYSEDDTIEDVLESEPHLKERYNTEVEFLEKGFVIITKYIDYSDESLADLVCEMAKTSPDNVVVLHNE